MGQNSKKWEVPCCKNWKERAKKKVEEVEHLVNEVEVARKESRAADVTAMEEQLRQMLRDWKAELHDDHPTPPSSCIVENSLGSSFSELDRLLWQDEAEDDVTSSLATTGLIHAIDALAVADSAHDKVENSNGSSFSELDCLLWQNDAEDDVTSSLATTGLIHAIDALAVADSAQDKVVYDATHTSELQDLQDIENHMHQHEFQGFENYNGVAPSLQGTTINSFEDSGLQNLVDSNFDITAQLEEHRHLDVLENFENEIFVSLSGIEPWGVDDIPDSLELFSNINPPPSAFLGPKCALWDCARSALLSESCKNYCSSFHTELAVNESLHGVTPVVRAGGIDLKDGPLFAALKAKIEGKDVGIPECAGAATAKSPWNSPDLFDVSILKGEKIREWLFFDKPRRAYEKGSRKQRSLPDHEGRGWHESRKQIMKEFDGQKRSYYADPQPQEKFEWHLFEYEIIRCNTCALYRLELKVAEDKRKGRKTKDKIDPIVDLQKQMGRLTAEADVEDKCSGEAKVKGSLW